MSNQVYVRASFSIQKRVQTRPKHPRRAQARVRRAKTRQEAHKTGQRRPKRTPRRAKTRPGRPKMPPDPSRTPKMLPKSSQVGTKIGYALDVNFQKRFFENRAIPASVFEFFRFRGSKLGAKINQKSKFFVECVLRRFQDAPRRSQDVLKMRQDVPRTAQDRPEVVPWRLQDTPRRPKTAPRWSQEARESAQDAARSEKKRGTKAIRSTTPDLVFGAFSIGFWNVFGWFWDDFGSLGVGF